MRIQIDELWMTQRKLRNPEQIPIMVSDVREIQALPPVEILELEDGSLEINNGHHRCIALHLAGIQHLEYGEYILLPVAQSWKRRCGKIKDSPLLSEFVRTT